MRDRRGLSTLELVLALPILLGVMALMVNFGTAACWKVRALVMARQRLWEGRTGRTGEASSTPTWWPGNVTTGGGHMSALDDPRVNLPVARGPLPPGAEANSDLLDPTRGLRTASSELTRAFPMLKSMGTYHLTANSALLDDKWAFYRKMSAWYYSERRSPFLYTFQKASPEFGEAYVKAVVAIIVAPFRKSLRPLDKDDEFLYYNTLFGWGTTSPDFHPPLNGFCDVDRELADLRVQDLIDRIQGKPEQGEGDNITPPVPDVAERMTRAFIDLYERVIHEIKNLKNRNPPLSPDQAAALEAQLPSLRAKVDILSRFLKRLTSR
jgi:hypothetical protein